MLEISEKWEALVKNVAAQNSSCQLQVSGSRFQVPGYPFSLHPVTCNLELILYLH